MLAIEVVAPEFLRLRDEHPPLDCIAHDLKFGEGIACRVPTNCRG